MKQIWYPWTEWECYAAGMYDGETAMSPDEAKAAYANFLRDIPRFQRAMKRVMKEWPKSCEHFLTNPNINRLAWLGQAAMCIETGVSRKHRAGFMLMTSEECGAANAAAQITLNEWVNEHEGKNRAILERMAQARLF